MFERKEIALERGQEEANKVHFVSMLRPEPFIGATIIGANIEDSLLYHWFRDWHGVEFVENSEIARRLRKMPETIGERLKVSYFIPGNRYASKYLFNQEGTEGVSNHEKMNRLAIAEFNGEPFLYAPNNGTKSAIEDEPNCTRVPVVCHGLNRFSGYHNAYCPIALNREPFHLHILEKGYGLSRDVIHRATAQETVYQIVSRTSLRLFDSTALVHAIVPDYATAQRLADLYGSTKVDRLGSLFERPAPLTSAEKQRRYRERQKAAQSPDVVLASKEPPKEGDDSLIMTVTMCASAYAKARGDFSQQTVSLADFMAFLRAQSRRKVTRKEGSLFNLSTFNPPEGAEDYRTLEHFKSASGLVLDFDDGEVSPQEFERIFWSEAGRGRKMSFALMNTYSRDATKPNKFRVIVPFRRPAQSVEEFHAVYDYIVRRIEERGYRTPPRVPDGTDVDAGGLDRSSRSPTQFFYWPCTNAAHPEGAFFRVCGLQRRELERYAIDPQDVAMNAPAPPIVVPVPMPTGSSDQEKIDEAIRQWRDVGCAPGNGNHEFYRLGLRLASSGLPEYEIERTLAEQSQFAHTPKDRRRNIPYVMKRLRQRRGQTLGPAATTALLNPSHSVASLTTAGGLVRQR